MMLLQETAEMPLSDWLQVQSNGKTHELTHNGGKSRSHQAEQEVALTSVVKHNGHLDEVTVT